MFLSFKIDVHPVMFHVSAPKSLLCSFRNIVILNLFLYFLLVEKHKKIEKDLTVDMA